MKTFQIITLAVFVLLAIGGIVAFATYRSDSGEGTGGAVSIWGILPATAVNPFLQEVSTGKKDFVINYRQISEENFDKELVEAIASGRSPDAIFLPDDLIVRFQDKVAVIPYENYPEREFKETFIQEGELYLTQSGSLGIPFSIDPLVMYWNRDLFGSAGLATYPKTWNEVLLLPSKLTVKDRTSNIVQSAVALGEYGNVTHAKKIISALLLQAGNPITDRKTQGGLESVLATAGGGVASSVLGFYTEFGNPVKPIYSWNRSLPPSKNFFLSEDLAIYFGFASELSDLRAKNPNLNFSVAPFPQLVDTRVKRTYGRMYALSVLKTAPNITGAYQAILTLTDSSSISIWSKRQSLPPVRRDLISSVANDAAGTIFAEAALQSYGWLDPNPQITDGIFRSMIESISSGSRRLEEAISRANAELENVR
ncbi:MAG: extracellular solute-binding protein [bacterium]|nr:extracellular solute-binding protein [bacterium]